VTHPLDDPAIVSRLFYPRRAVQGRSENPNAKDGLIPVDDTASLGYRYFTDPSAERVLLYFHGNGEVAADYDFIAPLYAHIGVVLLVVDYRGYGWSTGQPLTSTLLTDGEAVLPKLDDILGEASKLPLYLMGRSLGSGPAIHLAHKSSEHFVGLIIESGFADMPSVFRRLQIPVDLDTITDLPIGNARRMQEISLPTLIIHGEADQLLPVENGQQLYDAAGATHKRILRVPNAGHNDLLGRASRDRYMAALGQFFAAVEAD